MCDLFYFPNWSYFVENICGLWFKSPKNSTSFFWPNLHKNTLGIFKRIYLWNILKKVQLVHLNDILFLPLDRLTRGVNMWTHPKCNFNLNRLVKLRKNKQKKPIIFWMWWAVTFFAKSQCLGFFFASTHGGLACMERDTGGISCYSSWWIYGIIGLNQV